MTSIIVALFLHYRFCAPQCGFSLPFDRLRMHGSKVLFFFGSSFFARWAKNEEPEDLN
jgi:hypothetical protein